jgi:hypothetical protein
VSRLSRVGLPCPAVTAAVRPPGTPVRDDPSASHGRAAVAVPRERVADSGGELTVHHDHGRFTTAARSPRPAPAQRTTTRKDNP